MSYTGKKNVYTCDECGKALVTVDADDGVTPFMILCKEPGCRGWAKSACYRVDQSLEATHEWRHALPKEYRKDAGCREHFENGGLFLFRVGEKA